MLTDGFEAILDALPDGVMVVDPQGEVLFASLGAGRLLGCPRSSLVGRSVDTLHPCVGVAVRRAEDRRDDPNDPAAARDRPGPGAVTAAKWIDGPDDGLNVQLAAIRVGIATLMVVSLRERAVS